MQYPKLVANKEALVYNAQKVIKMCHDAKIELTAVVKVTGGNPEFAKMYLELGADMIGDSQISNVINMRHAGVKGPFMLLRVPMLSEIEEVVENVDVALVSELKTTRILGEEASRHGKTQKILYMIDVGDLREGVWYEKAVEEVVRASKIKSIELYGVGTNLGCYGGVIPDVENMTILSKIADEIKSQGVELKVVSGGNTSALYLVENGILPKGINSYRVGEALVLGNDVTNGRAFSFLRQDTFTLWAEIVELKTKPSLPQGKIGRDAMGRIPIFEDRGKRLKAIIAIGEQDVPSDGLKPLDKGIQVLHASSDYTILDVTDCKKEFEIGDKIGFNLTYAALLHTMTSKYVVKEMILR